MLYWLTDKLLIGYIYSSILFVTLRIFNKTAREKSTGYLNLANAVLLIGLILHLVTQIITLVDCKELQSNLSQHTGITLYPISRSNCYTMLVWSIVLGFAFQWCFLFRKYRVNIWLTVISILLLLIMTNIDNISVALTSLFSDYIPSSWVVYDNTKALVGRTIAVAVYFLVCWIIPQTRDKQTAVWN